MTERHEIRTLLAPPNPEAERRRARRTLARRATGAEDLAELLDMLGLVPRVGEST